MSQETVRRLLRLAGLRSPRLGMMVLADTSREDWLDGSGPALTLIGYQDDATVQVLACRFQCEHENTLGYLRLLLALVKRWPR